MGASTFALQSCSDDGHGSKPVLGPSTVVLRLPADLGDMRRPAVSFDHQKHTTELGPDCKACHRLRDGNELDFGPLVTNASSADDAMHAYHDACMPCHQQRASAGQKTGPVTCNACHDHVPGSTVARVDLHFDYSLHHRHDRAEDGKCETCHHVYDEEQGKLVYQKGAESACRNCHGSKDEGRNPSLRRAVHDDCVNCHTNRSAAGEKSGPVHCVGCHESQQVADIEPLERVPRLMRGQPDKTWIRTDGATANLVPFNHAYHEVGLTKNCSSCHHETLRACKDCHTLEGKAEGGHVPLERAYHMPTSTHSCVGCHEQVATQRANCAGCHHALPAGPGDASCRRCHSGPESDTDPASLPAPGMPPVQMAELPLTSPDFPDHIELEYMPGGDYGAARLPHRLIVEKLDQAARDSKLASRFHGQVETLCAGCHHHTPLGSRPPKCQSCHAADNEPAGDRPGLKAAFHRQCIECHQQMDIKAGCKDCHAEASKEDNQ